MKPLLISIGAFNVLDYFMTLHFLQQGFIEGNPIMASVVDTASFFLIKIVLMPLALYLIWAIRHRIGRPTLASLWVCAGVYAGLIGYFAVLLGSRMA